MPPPTRPRIIPVLDVMGGRVVRAVGGRRSEYRPVVSRLTDSTDPVEVARALLELTGSDELYVADLDAILDPAWDGGLAARLSDAFPHTAVLIDVGIRTAADARKLPAFRPRKPWPVIGWPRWERRRNLVPVVGTESVGPAGDWEAAVEEFLPDVAVSIDLSDGAWLGRWEAWAGWGVTAADPAAVAEAVATVAPHAVILLDLGRVGERRGPHPEVVRLLRQVRDRHPDREAVRLAAGGGVRNWDDVDTLAEAGADAVLVASALHDGTLTFPRPV